MAEALPSGIHKEHSQQDAIDHRQLNQIEHSLAQAAEPEEAMITPIV